MAEGQVLTEEKIGQIIEAALLAADGPLTVENLFKLFADGELEEENGRKQIRDVLIALEEACSERGVELIRVASGYRYQARQDLSAWVSRLWEEKPPRYTRALLETLALVAYKQPVTRGDIEQIRGVGVSQNIMRTLLERDWIRVVGQREAPGRPSLYGTTKTFLDYFNLHNLDQLPPLEEIRALIEPTLVAESLAQDSVTEDGAPVHGSDEVETQPDAESGEENSDNAGDEVILEADDVDDVDDVDEADEADEADDGSENNDLDESHRSHNDAASQQQDASSEDEHANEQEEAAAADGVLNQSANETTPPQSEQN